MKYKVICDKTNNSPQDIAEGKVNVTVITGSFNHIDRMQQTIYYTKLLTLSLHHNIRLIEDYLLEVITDTPQDIPNLQHVVNQMFPKYKHTLDQLLLLA